MLAHGEVFPVQFLHFGQHFGHQSLAEGDEFLGLVGDILQFEDDLCLQIEDGALQGHLAGGGLFFFQAEKLKVTAQIEDVEFFLVLAVDQPRTQAGAAADHLPEFGLAHDLFEEYQVEHFGHIDAGVQHIHRDGDLGQFSGVGKFVDGTLGVGHIVVDDLGIAGQVGVLLVEDVQDGFGVAVVLGEDDGLAQFFAVVDFEAVGHQQVEGFADGILVEEPFVEGGGLDAFGQFAVFVGEGGLVLGLFLGGEFVVDDALFEEFEFAFHRAVVHEEPVLDGLGQFVAVGGHAVLQLKDFVGVFVDFVLGGGGQAHQRGVKVVEDVPVFVVDGAVGLVADDQIEVAHGEEFALLVVDGVDAVHHGLVGGKYAVGGGVVLFLAEVGDRQIGQQVHKAAFGLGDQRIAVGQKENVFHPAAAQQHIAEGDDGAGLAGTGGHDQQGLAAVLGKGLAGGLDGALLVPAPGDVAVHLDVIQRCAHRPQIEELFQVPAGIEGGHPALGVEAVVQAGVKAVGEKDHRAAAALLFQKVGVEFGLLAALGGVHTGFLRLNDGQGAVGVVVERIVGKALPGAVGHTGNRHFVEPVFALHPAGIPQHGVDVELAGLVLR